MRWKDVNLKPDGRLLRQFGGLCATVCAFVAIWQFAYHHKQLPAIALGIAALLFSIVALVRPNILRWVFVASTVATFPIGWAVSNLVLFLLYFGMITPLAIFFRWSGRDLLDLKPPSESEPTFWDSKQIDRDKRSYFKQF